MGGDGHNPREARFGMVWGVAEGDGRQGWPAALAALMPGLGAVLVALITRLDFPPYHDEQNYLLLSRAFARGVTYERLTRFEGIASAIGPGMYLVYGGWFRLTGDDSLRTGRVLSVVWAGLGGAVLVSLGRFVAPKRPLWLGMSVLALPYFLATAITMLSEPICLLASALGIGGWLLGATTGRGFWFWLAVLPLALALNVRLPNLALPIALAASGLIVLRRRDAALVSLLAIAAQTPLWMLWGSLMPPTQGLGVIREVSGQRAGFHPTSLAHLLAMLGLALWPALRWPRRCWIWALWILAGLIYGMFILPGLDVRFAGPLQKLGTLRGGVLRPLLILPFLAGLGLAALGARRALDPARSVASRTFLLLGLAGLGIFLASPLGFERYSLMFIHYWMLAFWPDLMQRRGLWGAWLTALLALDAILVWVVARGAPLGA
jgi:hypothetical protein